MTNDETIRLIADTVSKSFLLVLVFTTIVSFTTGIAVSIHISWKIDELKKLITSHEVETNEET